MLLQQEIRISDQSSRSYAKASGCDLHIEQTLFGYRLNFNFAIETYPREPEEPLVTLLGWEMDLNYRNEARVILVGRMLSDLGEHPRDLGRHRFTLSRYFDLRNNEFLQLVDRSHRGNVTFEFRATPVLSGIPHNGSTEEGRLVIPHSEWLQLLNRTGMDRYELISIRIPVASSHLHKPFVDAVAKIREAESQYTRGEWNGAASSCRSAWRTILSNTPPGVPPFEHLLAPVIGDPRRKAFAMTLIKGLHDITNEAVHLEGDVKKGTLPADLTPEDALLCIHWYTAVIGYLSSL
ncbi:MAG: hypothetical protein QOJ64_3455 [Acidobacteriota bacterium]|jgi:hypothetical protein|nr:hypothetical protein [Acidobacteriota bacterium]